MKSRWLLAVVGVLLLFPRIGSSQAVCPCIAPPPTADDQVHVSDSTSAATWRTVPNCPAGALAYTTLTNAFSCVAPFAVADVSIDTVLGTENVVLMTTGAEAKKVTLPSAASTVTRPYVVIKKDTALGEMRVFPDGTDLLNGRNGFVSTGIAGTGFRLTWLSASAGWLAEPLNMPLRVEDLRNGTTGQGFAVLQTSPLLLGGNALEMAVTMNGHLEFRGTAPTVATGGADCGTAPTITGNDVLGKVTVGTSPGGKCTVTFANAWSQAPSCHCQNITAAQLCRGVNATTTTVELTGTLAAANALEFRCAANY